MKKYLTLCLLFFFLNLYSTAQASIDPKLRVVIERTTTLEDLERIKADMALLGYEFTTSDISFNAAGEIQAISGAVNFGKGNRATFHTDELKYRIVITRRGESFSIKVNSRFY